MLVRSLVASSALSFAAAGLCGHLIASDLRLAPAANRTVAETAELLVNSERLPGISFAVVHDGSVTESGTVGVVDTASAESITPDTLFEAASLTKPLVAYMALLEVDRGTLELDRPAADYIGTPQRIAQPEVWRTVTIRHLLSHRSGLPNWSGNPGRPHRTDPLTFAFEPGEDFRYSGEGYGLLMLAIAEAAQTTPEALAASTLATLGMTNSSMTAVDLDGSYARGHWRLVPDRPVRRTEQAVAAFSLVTTATDYAQLLIAWMNPPVSRDTLRAFTDPALGDHSALPTGVGWSLGWGTVTGDKTGLLFQWGDNGAFRAFAGIDASAGRAIVYLSNGSLGTLQANALAYPVLGDTAPASDWFADSWLELARLWVRD